MLNRKAAFTWLCIAQSPPFLFFARAMSTSSTVTTGQTTINLLDVAAAAIASTVTATRWIRQMTDTTSVRKKDDGSVVTDADGLAQGAILKALHKVSTDLRIVGEESAEEMSQHLGTHALDDIEEDVWKRCHAEVRLRYRQRHTKPESTASLPLSSNTVDFVSPTQSDNDPEDCVVDISRVSVFVDPLDGTKSYAHGEYDCVSILIGIVLDNEPIFGVVGKPFGYTDLTPILDTNCVTIYGGPLINGVYVAGANAITVTPSNALPKAVISNSRSIGIVHDFVVYLGRKGLISPDPLLISGAGEKSLRLILQHSNEALWFYPKAGTSLWDVAASDALLRVLGGKLTDKFGNNMNYDKTRAEAENVDGVIACIDPKLHAECIRIFHNEDWQESL